MTQERAWLRWAKKEGIIAKDGTAFKAADVLKIPDNKFLADLDAQVLDLALTAFVAGWDAHKKTKKRKR